VIRHENGVVVGDVRLESLGEFRRSRRAITGEGNASQAHNDFADQGLGEGDACGGKAGRGGRMGVDYRAHIRAQAIDQQVHADLAGHVAAAGDALAFPIDDNHVGQTHGALADAGGGDQDTIVVQADGEVAVHGGHEAAGVQHSSVADDLFPVFAFLGHWYLSRGVYDKRRPRALPAEPRRPSLQHPHSTSSLRAETIQFSGDSDATLVPFVLAGPGLSL